MILPARRSALRPVFSSAAAYSETQPVEVAVQLQQVVAFGVIGQTAAAAQDVAEPLGGDDERVVEGRQVGGDQPVGFLVIGDQGLQ